MVHLALSSTKGNQGLRYFPYSGYLGLTPIRVEGSKSKRSIVRTKLDADLKTLQAKSITISVRCYESRTGRVNVLHSNILVDYTQVLWSKPDGVEYEPIGNLEFPFRLSIPAKVAGFSTAVFVDYRCMWRVEAVLTHVPINGVGSRQIRHFELPLIRYDLPRFSTMSPSPEPMLSQLSKSRFLRIKYSTHPPKSPVGPLDLVPIPIHLQPLEQNVSIRSASVVVERRIYLHDVSQSSTSSSTPSPNSPALQSSSSASSLNKSSSASSPRLQQTSTSNSASSSSSSPIHSPQASESDPTSSTNSLTSSIPTITPGTIYPSSLSVSSETPLLANSTSSASPQTPSVKVIVNSIAGVESSGKFAHDAANGIWSKTLTIQWPAAKSHSRWAIGETITSELVSVKYFIRTKVVVTSPASGTETLELAEQELLVVSTNEAERELALAKYNELQDAMVIDGNVRSKSKSPRRSRPDREERIPPSPSVNTISNAVPSTPSLSGRSKPSSRRPHTSAGPRDKPVNFAGGAYGRPRGAEEEVPSGLPGQAPSSAPSSNSLATAKRRSDVVTSAPLRPDSSHSSSSASKKMRGNNSGGFLSGNGPGRASSSSFWSTVHSNGSAPKLKGSRSTSTTGSSSSMSSSTSHGNESEPSDDMREWEEELARIEMRSRKSSDLLGFSGKKKHSTSAPRLIVSPKQVDG